jgi:hypothetical protein
MHPIAGTAAAVVLLLAAIWHEQPPPAAPAAPPAPAQACSCGGSAAGSGAAGGGGGSVRDPGVFAAQPGELALSVSGGVSIVDGTLAVDDGDIVLNGRSLRTVLAAIVEQGRASCGGIPCVRGVHDFLRTCQCICEAGWTGAACDVFDCFGHGDWNAALQRCDCDPPYERSTQCEYRQCRGVMATSCAPLLSTGCDADGVFPADNCTERCAAPQSCAYRLNWGRSRLPTLDYMVGLCGAAFSADGAFASFAAMQCASSLSSDECVGIFELEAPFCCLYGADCGRPTCSSASCCAQRTARSSCLAAGCAWASGRVCALPALIDTTRDCELPPRLNVSGLWSVNVVGCDDAACPVTARDRYIAAIVDVCGAAAAGGAAGGALNASSACLAPLRARLDGESWPELISGPLPSLAPFTIAAASGSVSAVGACRSKGSPFSQLCLVPSAKALTFTFVPGTPASLLSEWQEEHASGFLVTHVDGRIACVATSEIDELLQVQLYSADGIYLVAAAASQPGCGVFVLPPPLLPDSSSSGGDFRDEAGERVAVADSAGLLSWGESSEILYSIVPSRQ